MRKRGVRPAGDDRRKRNALTPLSAHEELELERHVALGNANTQNSLSEYVVKGTIGEFLRAPDRREFALVFDGPDLFHPVVRLDDISHERI